ncbi:MAG: hypothetical protein QOG13_1228 [Sphingomonadales bacterium]|jgi:hypothetical protein|nr:hypothetical protein [Sphingomonadales bacterium]
MNEVIVTGARNSRNVDGAGNNLARGLGRSGDRDSWATI